MSSRVELLPKLSQQRQVMIYDNLSEAIRPIAALRQALSVRIYRRQRSVMILGHHSESDGRIVQILRRPLEHAYQKR